MQISAPLQSDCLYFVLTLRNVGLMLCHRLRRWPSIKPVFLHHEHAWSVSIPVIEKTINKKILNFKICIRGGGGYLALAYPEDHRPDIQRLLASMVTY